MSVHSGSRGMAFDANGDLLETDEGGIYRLTQPSLAANREFAGKIRERLERISSLRDVQFGQATDYPTVDVAVNRERAGLMGVKMSEVSRSLVAATSSSRFLVSNYWADPNSGVAYQIQVQVPGGSFNEMHQNIAGTPQLAQDSEYVFFLWTGPSRATHLLGLSQGVLDIVKDSAGAASIVRQTSAVVAVDSTGAAGGSAGGRWFGRGRGVIPRRLPEQ